MRYLSARINIPRCRKAWYLDRTNQQPRRKRRGTVLNVSHCVFYKVVAVGFNTLYYDASVGVLNSPHE